MKKHTRFYLLMAIIGTVAAMALTVNPAFAKPTDSQDRMAQLKEKLREAVELINESTLMAAKADETGDLDLAQKALEMNKKAMALLEEVADALKGAADPEMEMATCDVFDALVTALDLLSSAADRIAKISDDEKTVQAAEKLKTMVADAVAMMRVKLKRANLACLDRDTEEAFEQERAEERVGDNFEPEEASKR